MRRLQSSVAAAKLALVLALAFGGHLPGCGYSFRDSLDPSVKTVYVPIFKSQTFRRDLNLQLNGLALQGDREADAVQGRGHPGGGRHYH